MTTMLTTTPPLFSRTRRFGTLLDWDPMRLLADDLLAHQPADSELVWSNVPVNVQTTADGATITVDLPGVAPEDVDLTFDRGRLAIAGKRGARTYRYAVTLDDSIDPDRLEAQLDKGVLVIHAHKKAEAKPRKIAITTTGAPSGKTLDAGR